MKTGLNYLIYLSLINIFISCEETTISDHVFEKAQILSFVVDDKEYQIHDQVLTATFPLDKNVSALRPTIRISIGAKVLPRSGEPQNFNEEVVYTVVAGNGIEKKFRVITKLEEPQPPEIESFKVGNRPFRIVGDKIIATFPIGSDVSKLTPEIVLSPYATVSPMSGVAQDFSTPVEYTVLLNEGNAKTYTVIAEVTLSDEKEIHSFVVENQVYTVRGNIISYSYLTGTDISSMRPQIKFSDRSKISPEPMIAQDFRYPTKYIVTAEDGTRKTYSVQVSLISPIAKNDRGIVYIKQEYMDKVSPGDQFPFEGRNYTIVNENMLREHIATFQYDKLPYLVTTKVTNMNRLFEQLETFKTDISSWDVSNVTDMSYMFHGAKFFNRDISSWDVSNVTDMSYMFAQAINFNRKIGGWNTARVETMSNMFYKAERFNRDIGKWNTSNVQTMKNMFYGANDFNQVIKRWDVSRVTDMSQMFAEAYQFNANLMNWNVGKVTTMSKMFYKAISFNQGIGTWNTRYVEDMSFMFQHAVSFNKDISNWNMSSAIFLESMFHGAERFNQKIGKWRLKGNIHLKSMFKNAESFNQSLEKWDVSKVTDFSEMFMNAKEFNNDVSNWDMSSAVDLTSMFHGAKSFNKNIQKWNVKNVKNVNYFLYQTDNFKGRLDGWCFPHIENMPPQFSDNPKYTNSNYLFQQPRWGICRRLY